MQHPSASLQDLGFTEIESRIYDYLVTNSPVTGYKISQQIGKPTPNTYKAITVLAQKGAILVDEGDMRLCRPVPPKELFGRLTREFAARCAAAEARLESAAADSKDDRVYRIESLGQVLERARTMLQEAQSIVLLDIMPGPLALLRDEMEAAVHRSVRVVAFVYEAVEDAGFEWSTSQTDSQFLKRWPGQQLSVCVDAEEHLVALLSQECDAVHQAIWSRSTFLSCMQHNSIAAELQLAEQRHRDVDSDIATDFANISLLLAAPPGLETLRSNYR